VSQMRGASDGGEATTHLIATRLQQSLYGAAGRLLSQVAGALLLLLANPDRQRLDRHLPAITASARAFAEHLVATPLPTASEQLLRSVQERLSSITLWLQRTGSPDQLSDRDIDAALAELQHIRRVLISAGAQSCRFSMVAFAAGCCCGHHDDQTNIESMAS